MKKVFCFGELLLRYSPAFNREWIRDSSMPVFIGGAELNVATALARWSIPAKYVTALPDHALSKEIIQELQNKNIDVSRVLFQGNRIGTYYLPQGADLKDTGVIYDRAGSSFGELQPGMIDWNTALMECDWFHFSAISPALNENVAAVCKEALAAASARGLTISVDLNYRSKLWQYGKQPVDIMPELVNHCQVIMGNLWSAETLLGVEAPIKESLGKSSEELLVAAKESIARLKKQFVAAESFAYTFRLDNKYWAFLQTADDTFSSPHFPVRDVIDQAGSGDCFMAGLIYGLKQGIPSQDIINYAAAAAVGKLYEKGDSTNQTVEQIFARQ